MKKIIDESNYEIEQLESDEKKTKLLFEKEKQSLEKYLEIIYMKIQKEGTTSSDKIKECKNLTFSSINSKEFISLSFQNINIASTRSKQNRNIIKVHNKNSKFNKTLTNFPKKYNEEYSKGNLNQSLKNIFNCHKDPRFLNMGI